MSNIPHSPERNAPDPILPDPIGEGGFIQPREPDETSGGGGGGGAGTPARRSPELPDQPSEG